MAEGARARFGAGVAVAVTGIAGPGGGSAEKPVGLVFISVASRDGTKVRRFELPGERASVRARTALLALHMLRRVLTRTDTDSRESAG